MTEKKFYTTTSTAGTYYTYTRDGKFTGYATFPGIGVRWAPPKVKAKIIADAKGRRVSDRKREEKR